MRIGRAAAALLLGAASIAASPPADVFDTCGEAYDGLRRPGPTRSIYVPMRDGVRVALDVILPDPLPDGGKVPTVLIMTRYWRAPNATTTDIVRFYVSHGYAVVNGDVRGTGASFGAWPHHRNRDETLDFGDIMDWITRQPWSDGKIAGWGVSYRANTADWMAERGHPAFVAEMSRFPDYDPYQHLYFPGGVPHSNFGKAWGLWVKGLDLGTNDRAPPGSEIARGIKPVDEDPDGRMLRLAIAARRDVPDVWQSLQTITFRDDRPGAWGGWSMDDFGIHAWAKSVERSGTAIQSWGGWMDAGTADGVLRRFMTLSNPQRAYVGPWSHAGLHNVSQYLPVDAPTDPAMERQHLADLCFLKGETAGRRIGTAVASRKLLTYYTMGEERWKTTTHWPPPNTVRTRWYFRAGNALDRAPPAEGSGADRYSVDFDVTTGQRNRWWTQNNSTDVDYGDRAAGDARLLTYTSPPLDMDLEVTGHPVVTLQVRSTHADGAFFVYLEDVAPDGRVRYVTEGQLRAIHRKVSPDRPPYPVVGPYHSFRRADAMPLVPGEAAELAFELLPTSVLVRKGHRLRVAIAGADKDSFRRVPETGDPTVTIERNRALASHIDLPVIPRK